MLKGIEAQLMVTRTADLARDAGAMQRKNDLVRDYLALQTQALAEQEKKQAPKTLNAQEAVIHKDKQGGGQSFKEEGDEEDNAFFTGEDEDYVIPPSANNSTIDIKI